MGPLALELLEAGASPVDALEKLAADDEHFDYRQIGIVDRDGRAAARSGDKTRSWAGHVLGDAYVSMGNALAGQRVVEAMAQAFERMPDENLDERLLRAIEAGREAGGQGHLRERSAGVMVHGGGRRLNLDLRVDAHDSAVDELRRVHDAYVPYTPYYEMRAGEPHNTPLQEDWSKEHGIEE